MVLQCRCGARKGGEETLYNGNYNVMLVSCVRICICMHMYVSSSRGMQCSVIVGMYCAMQSLCCVIVAVSNNVLLHSIYF